MENVFLAPCAFLYCVPLRSSHFVVCILECSRREPKCNKLHYSCLFNSLFVSDLTEPRKVLESLIQCTCTCTCMQYKRYPGNNFYDCFCVPITCERVFCCCCCSLFLWAVVYMWCSMAMKVKFLRKKKHDFPPLGQSWNIRPSSGSHVWRHSVCWTAA